MHNATNRIGMRKRFLGKNFLLTTVFLWAIVNGLKCKAAAPTGIAAANIEIENAEAGAPPLFFNRLRVSRPRVEVGASTLHSLFDLGANYESKLDFTKRHEKVVALLRMAILLLDEVFTWKGARGRVGLDLICRLP